MFQSMLPIACRANSIAVLRWLIDVVKIDLNVVDKVRIYISLYRCMCVYCILLCSLIDVSHTALTFCGSVMSQFGVSSFVSACKFGHTDILETMTSSAWKPTEEVSMIAYVYQTIATRSQSYSAYLQDITGSFDVCRNSHCFANLSCGELLAYSLCFFTRCFSCTFCFGCS